MSLLPTNRSTSNTPAEHVDDHNEIHRLHDIFETAYTDAVLAGFPGDELEWVQSLPGSVWRNGHGVPSDAVGIDGDYYLDIDTGNLYKRASGTYGSPIFNVGSGLPIGGSIGQILTNIGPGAGDWQDGPFDPIGAAAAAQAASQPLDSDLTAIAALSTTSFGRSFLDRADAAAGRTLLGLGTAAVAATSDFDAAGAAAAAQAASQPLDSDLTAIAALSTTSFGRSLLTQADAAATRTTLGLGTAATSASTDFDAAGAAAAAQAASQPLDADLTTIAGLTATTDNIIQSVAGAWASRTPAQLKATLAITTGDVSGLGTASTHPATDFALVANNLSDLANVQTALNNLAGATTNNRVLAGDGTNVTLRTLVAADIPSLDAAKTTTGTFAIGRIPTGTDNTQVPTGGVITAAGPQGDASHTQVLTWNAAGQLTAVTNTAIAIANTAVSGLGTISTLSKTPSGGDLTGDWPASTVAAGAITLAKQANLAANSIIGNNTGSAATPLALSASQVKSLLAISTSDVSGLGTVATQAASNVFLLDSSVNVNAGTLGALDIQITNDLGLGTVFRLNSVKTTGGAIAIGTALGGLQFRGAYNSTPQFQAGAQIAALAEEAFSSGHAGACIDLHTNAIGTANANPTRRLRLDNAGTLHGSPTITSSLVSAANWAIKSDGSLYAGGGLTYSSNQPTAANFSVNTSGNGSFAGTLSVTGHVTLEGVTSTGATGTGKLVFDGTPTLVTPNIGAATGTSLACSGAVTGTNTWDSNVQVTTSDATTTSTTLVDITGLTASVVSGTYEFEAVLKVVTATDTQGTNYGIKLTQNLTAIEGMMISSTSTTAFATQRISASSTAPATASLTGNSSQNGMVTIKGIAIMSGSATLSVQHLKVSGSGNSTVKVGSILKFKKVA